MQQMKAQRWSPVRYRCIVITETSADIKDRDVTKTEHNIEENRMGTQPSTKQGLTKFLPRA